jgi:methionyl aminopeptidase
MEAVENKCWTPGCGKKATMICPTCKSMDLDPTYFCSQDCFKKIWTIHKLVHIPREEQQKKKNEGFKFSGPLRPGIISKKRPIPEHIVKPDYFYTSVPKKEQESKFQKDIEVKSEEDIKKMREIGILARKTLDIGHSVVKAGVTTDYIDEVVHNFCIENGAYPSPYNYYKFPKSLCTSVNEVICHGIPDDRPLENGDIVNLDVTIYKNGVHVDLNETYLVGEVAESSKFLVTKAYESLQKAIEICKPGTMYREVGNVITKYIEENG